jgi:hypothetical protein
MAQDEKIQYFPLISKSGAVFRMIPHFGHHTDADVISRRKYCQK